MTDLTTTPQLNKLALPDPVAKSIANPNAFAKPGAMAKPGNQGTRFRPLTTKTPARQRKRKRDPRQVRFY